MQWAEIASNIFFTMVFMWLIVWTLLAWGFGVTNFKSKHGQVLGFIGYTFWTLLILTHIVAIVVLWQASVSTIWLIIVLLISHIVFGLLFGRNVSTR